jgi:dTDP-glucose 4,6-dehydratase
MRRPWCAICWEVIARAHSRSILIPTPGFAVKAALALLDRVGLPLLYPEQFRIADLDIQLDTTATRDALGWAPTRQDSDILAEAYALFMDTRGQISSGLIPA